MLSFYLVIFIAGEYSWPVKVYANDIKLLSRLLVLEEDDILRDRKGVQSASYLLSGMGGGVHAVVVDSGQSLGQLSGSKKALRSICT